MVTGVDGENAGDDSNKERWRDKRNDEGEKCAARGVT
jgi:hypothetical protein